jgi:hypothetical protein
MSYIDDISKALLLVLDHASDDSPEAFAGYATNRDFWVAETAHCLAVIQGYDERFQRMKEASEASDPPKMDWPTIPVSKASVSGKELRQVRTKLRDSARRFLRRCAKMFPDERFAIYKDAKRLGIPTPP